MHKLASWFYFYMKKMDITIGSEARDEVPGDMPLRIMPADETTSMHKNLLVYSEVIHAVSSCSSEYNLKCQKVSASVSVVILTVVLCCYLLLKHTIAHCDHNMH